MSAREEEVSMSAQVAALVGVTLSHSSIIHKQNALLSDSVLSVNVDFSPPELGM